MDPEFGNWQAKELTSHLEHVFCNLPIDIVRTKKSLEVLPSQMKKVKLVKLLVKQLGKKFHSFMPLKTSPNILITPIQC
jgi:hypothetical protein